MSELGIPLDKSLPGRSVTNSIGRSTEELQDMARG